MILKVLIPLLAILFHNVLVGLPPFDDEIILLLLKLVEVVLDLGVVPDVRVLIQHEQVQQDGVNQEAKSEAEEERLSMQ